ncbi:histidine kinase dimerization/phospho-acceptor domain-containing protein [Siccirubricoccus deserti]
MTGLASPARGVAARREHGDCLCRAGRGGTQCTGARGLLASALDAARSELARSLAEADRLNRALRELNTTLEERVAERTRQLEAEMAQRREVEAALAQAQKMEALGHLTGGVAHDFNNLLTGVSGSLALMRRRIEQGRVGEIGRYIDTAAAAAGRAAVLTHRLLAFSRRQPLEPKPVDLNRLVAGITELLHRSLGETIELEGAGCTAVAGGGRRWPDGERASEPGGERA